MNNSTYNTIAENAKSTVVAECPHNIKKKKAGGYESEDQLEKAFIKQLESQAYEYLPITEEKELKENLRKQLEKLNKCKFSDNEWGQFFVNELANSNQDILAKTTTIQEDYIKNIILDNGKSKNIYLLDKKDIHNNTLQVINQYATKDGKHANRYDVTVLVNGFPLVHIELKRRGVALQEAFNQIERYQRESFWAASGLFEYVQLFVVSNGTHTKYYSNTTRKKHIDNITKSKNQNIKGKKSSHSFEFTNWWADATNKPITDLMDFSRTFFAKHTILNILTRYCVFTSEKDLLAMRPYQIVATEKIINRIEISKNSKNLGTIDAGGYVWHTTGSGKTLTSFKTAQLASKLDYVDKVLFVVDRKDLDYQTIIEYDKFEEGAANSNTSTKILKTQLEDKGVQIIITTIQKLDCFIQGNSKHNIFNEHVVIIFDECHRSQSGDMHIGITKRFKNYNLFGFTGTPIFAINASSGGAHNLKTTEQAFGDKLHTYTIANAISDKNVLPFKVEYISTFHEAENIADERIQAIDREAALQDPRRITNIVEYIREHFNQKTKRTTTGQGGFNSILTVASIDLAKKYYIEFKKQLEGLPSDKQLKIATIYSYSANEESPEGFLDDENSGSTEGLDVSSRDFLESVIKDYNGMFGTSYDTSSYKFQNYYKDLSQRVKSREVDILIVVQMFLTGFDATTLNTLWVDKNLKLHGLLQAYSRTNRILNSIKTFGNVICFRNLEKATNESIALYGDKEASGVVLLKTFDEYYNGYVDGDKEITGYKSLVEQLLAKFPVGEPIVGEENEKEFIRLYGAILRMSNTLTTFDEFEGNEILTKRDTQDYQSQYIDLHEQKRKTENAEKENINDDLVFEMELIKQVEVNIDYIFSLVMKHHKDNTKDSEILIDINKAIDASIDLRNKKDLINAFVSSLNDGADVDEEWKGFIEKKRTEEFEKIISDENLTRDEAYKFIKNSFRDGSIETEGMALVNVIPPMSKFSGTNEKSEKRETVIKKLKDFFDRFFSISSRDI